MRAVAGCMSAPLSRLVRRYALVVGLGVLGGLVASEIYARWYFRAPDRLYLLPPGTHATYQPTPRGTPGIKGPSQFIVNSLGLRGDEPFQDAQQVIEVFGGSVSVDVWLD